MKQKKHGHYELFDKKRGKFIRSGSDKSKLGHTGAPSRSTIRINSCVAE